MSLKHSIPAFLTGLLCGAVLLALLYTQDGPTMAGTGEAAGNNGAISGNPDLETRHVEHAEKLIGLQFTPEQRDSMLDGLESNRQSYRNMRELSLDNNLPPSLLFDPVPHGKTFDREQQPINWDLPSQVSLPENREELAFYSVAELSVLIRTGRITSEELTRLFLDRLEQHGNTLEAVVTLTRERALEQARRVDRELDEGIYRGPLHGIPYGAKDLFALPDHPTTWGAEPYKDQKIDHTAAVIEQLDEAGAVLVGKLTMGALAWGDVWYDGKTRNPWNPEQGSSGSSAGSGAATAAGLVPFALGTETLGSIISPSTRNGVTGLRPSFGRVSRDGAMALSWSMDKIGPMTRSAEDAALVFDAIRGPHGEDRTVRDLPFNYDPDLDPGELRIGYLEQAFERDYANRERDQRVLDVLEQMGVELVPFELPDLPAGALRFVLNVEGAAAFDELTRSGRDTLMVRQIQNAWPNVFRTSRFVPAVEYIQANRIRTMLIEQMQERMQKIDLYVAPTGGSANLMITNLTGHPAIAVPNGFTNEDQPASITFNGRLYDEATLLSVVRAYQQQTDHHRRHPPMFQP